MSVGSINPMTPAPNVRATNKGSESKVFGNDLGGYSGQYCDREIVGLVWRFISSRPNKLVGCKSLRVLFIGVEPSKIFQVL